MKHLFAKSLLLILFSCTLFSCQVTLSNEVKFSKTKQPVLDTLKLLFDFEQIQVLKSKDKAVNNADVITVNLINGKGLPSTDDSLSFYAVRIGSKVRSVMDDPKNYPYFRVNYVSKSSNGTATAKTSKGFEYTYSD